VLLKPPPAFSVSFAVNIDDPRQKLAFKARGLGWQKEEKALDILDLTIKFPTMSCRRKEVSFNVIRTVRYIQILIKADSVYRGYLEQLNCNEELTDKYLEVFR